MFYVNILKCFVLQWFASYIEIYQCNVILLYHQRRTARTIVSMIVKGEENELLELSTE